MGLMLDSTKEMKTDIHTEDFHMKVQSSIVHNSHQPKYHRTTVKTQRNYTMEYHTQYKRGTEKWRMWTNRRVWCLIKKASHEWKRKYIVWFQLFKKLNVILKNK